MAARAMWKGTIRFGKTSLPVKLYSAVQDRSVHFRLLHRKDRQPVKQEMRSADSGDTVEQKEIEKAYPVDRTHLVVLHREELEQLEPKDSREVEITRFVSPSEIDHRWYQRAYYLGPDGSDETYFALAEALSRKKKEGVAKWVMRKKSYIGSLRAEDGYLLLITLRHAEEVIAADSLEAPSGRPLQKRELAMAEQLLTSLEGRFDPQEYEDHYRTRVMELIETKARGGKVKVKAFRPKKTRDDALAKALEASLAGVGKKRASGGRGR